MKLAAHYPMWLGLALVLGKAGLAWGSTYYVDCQKGNDSNRGTETAPFRTIKKGVSGLKPKQAVAQSGIVRGVFHA